MFHKMKKIKCFAFKKNCSKGMVSGSNKYQPTVLDIFKEKQFRISKLSPFYTSAANRKTFFLNKKKLFCYWLYWREYHYKPSFILNMTLEYYFKKLLFWKVRGCFSFIFVHNRIVSLYHLLFLGHSNLIPINV